MSSVPGRRSGLLAMPQYIACLWVEHPWKCDEQLNCQGKSIPNVRSPLNCHPERSSLGPRRAIARWGKRSEGPAFAFSIAYPKTKGRKHSAQIQIVSICKKQAKSQ